MGETKSVLAFFIGLVFFIVLIGLAIGRVRTTNKKTSTTAKITPTQTISPSKKPGLIDSIKNIFSKKPSPTPTPKTKNQVLTDSNSESKNEPLISIDRFDPQTPNSELKQALEPNTTTKGGQPIETINTQTIPESGTPSLIIPISMLLGGLGIGLKKKQ